MLPAALYVVATPIGNLEDMTHRATRILSEAALVVAEDTRRSRILLDHYGIQRPLTSLHEHNEADKIPFLLERISNGDAVALISDAGTPLISDPGYRLVHHVAEAEMAVIPIPGPSAVTAALSVAGLPTDRFVFEGFLPARAGSRQKKLQQMLHEQRTMIFFESSHRIAACLGDMRDAFSGQRRGVICRELTKQFETVLRGSLDDLVERLGTDARQQKGEFVVLVEGADEPDVAIDGLALARELMEYLPASQAARVAARVTGGDRREIYSRLKTRSP